MTGPLIQAEIRFVLDEHPRVLWASDGIESLLGFAAEDLVNSTVLLNDRIHSADADLAEPLFTLPLEEEAGTMNLRLRHADGRIRCVRCKYSKAPAQKRSPATLDLLLQDAKSLWNPPDNEPVPVQFRALMENTDDFIFFKDRNHVFTHASQNILSPFGLDGERVCVLGQTDYDVFPEKYADIYYRLEKEVFSGVPVSSEVHESLKLDGKLAWLDNHKYPIKDDNGEIIGLFGIVRDITAQMRTQQALADTELRYRAIFDGAVEGIVRTTMDGHVVVANESAAAILGYDSIEDALSSIGDVGRDVWVDTVQRGLYLRSLVDGESHTVLGFECQFKRKDGSSMWVVLNGRLVYGDDWEPAYHDGFFVDITKRKRTEAALRSSEESLRRAQTIAGLGSYVGDLSNGDWKSSAVLDSIFGIGNDYPRTKEGWAALVHPDDRESMAAYFMNEILDQKKAFDKEYRIIRQSDGAVRWLQDRGRVEYDSQERPLRMNGIVQDITETKLFQAALHDSAESLRESQRIAGLGTYVLDISSGMWTSSDIQDQIFGIGKDFDRSVVGWTTLIHPEDRKSMAAYFANEVLGKSTPFDREYRIVRQSDSAVRWVHGLGRLEFDSKGQPVKMLGTIRDITERKLNEAALRESEESLKDAQRIAGIGSFVADIATGHVKRSEELYELFGIDRSYEESMAAWLAMVHPDDRAMMEEHIAHEVMGSGKPFNKEYRIIRPSDKAVRWMHVRGRAEFDAQGKPLKLRGTNQDVTERRQSEMALRESKELLQLFITHAPAGLAMFDREMHYLAVSRRWLEMHQITDRDVVGKSHYEFFPGLPESWREEHRRALAGELLPADERRILHADGSTQWVRREIIPWRTGDGAVGGIIIFSDDITWRIRAEAALRESKERLQLFIESAPVALAMFDTEMRYLTVSHCWARDHGVSGREMIGRSHYEINPDVPERWKATHRRGLQGERQQSEEDRYDRADGTIQWIRWEIIPWRADDGTIGGIIMLYQDISERKLAEAALRANSDLLEMFIQRAPAALAMFDREMRYLHASNRWLEDYSLLGKEIIGHSHYEIVPDIPERWKEVHRRGLAGETLRAEEDPFERADGTVQWIRWEVMPWRTADGAVGGIILFAEDITHLKQNAERLQLAASVFTNAREGILITDTSGKILEVNEMFTRITGYTRDEAIGGNPRMLKSGLQSEDFYANMWNSLLEDGQWSGEVWNRSKSGDIFAETLTINAVRDADGHVLQYVALFSDVTELKEHERQLEHVTHYDVLTSLPNRALLADRLRQAMTLPSQENRLLAVAYLDLDNFKEINDKHGHGAGDRLLTSLAFNMKCALRKGDTLARLGGDEFVAVLLDLNDVEASVPVLNRLLEAAAEAVQVGDSSLRLTASVGVAFYPQKDDVDADSLLRQADQAMYQAKLTGGNRYHIYDPEHDQLVRGRHENLEHIRHALAAREFVLYYQPKVNMRTGKVVGAEALLRWQHPQRGLLPPGMFLPVIDEDPLAVEVGEWVIDSALTQIEAWSAAGLDIPVSVNVGALQLQQPNFVDRLSSLLAAHPGVKPFHLELEVLETSALQDVAQTSQVLHSCQEIGVAFALDDFGTGYSSLTYLKRLPVNMLKIDQSFVSDMLEDPENLNILEGVLGLAAAFHRSVIAEGVETVEHGLMLLQLGCELAQGYGIARPMPARDLQGWVSSWRSDPRWAEVPPVHSRNRALLYASVEHRAWIAAFESFLQGKRHAPPALDERRCRLGIWLDAEEQAGRDKDPAYQSVKKVHRRFHELAAEIFSSMAAGRTSEGLGNLAVLHKQRDDLLGHLDTLRRQY